MISINYHILRPFESLETLNRHGQTHNDIKPENFSVKFENGYDQNNSSKNDLTQIEVVLTDFGMADPRSKGGTPVYASPECFEKTDTKSDIFSFGRLILFMLLPKEQFMKWLYIPIYNQAMILFRKQFLIFYLGKFSDILVIDHSKDGFKNFIEYDLEKFWNTSSIGFEYDFSH